MCTDNPPDPHDRSYHPAVDDIRNHIFRAKQALKLSIIDQENALKKIAQWKEVSPKSQYYFRPYRNASKHENGNGEEGGNSEDGI